MDKKENGVYLHSGILFSGEKGGYPACVMTWMYTEYIELSKISQRKKDRYCMISLI